MNRIVQTAKDIKKGEREQFITISPAGLLFCIPVVGEAAGSDGSALPAAPGRCDRQLRLLHDIIKNCENTFMETFSYLTAAGVGRASDIDTLGSLMKKDLDLIETVA
ncbi:hypothetical protein CDV55_100727 [Aspergillus turcosus]|uniref:Uncharacterized protein n=1 Tax=Aspergillus turcosus TaxID=1245748 RepID=A0A397GG96_9EURO|nr:hypothetical protein CDV55_100727 [Aspergillus turcosus]RLL99135.1 hypothetical protein CFD26_107755 [Aspergillus turcosus]